MSQRPQRNSKKRPVRTAILIVGEGQETERNYFDQLKREPEVKNRFAITVKGGHGFSQENVVREAIKLKKGASNRSEDYDEVRCVLDVEGPEKRDTLLAAIGLANQEGISLCFSNPAIEIWFLAHFVKQARPYKDCNAVLIELNKHWHKHFQREYHKNDERIYERIRERMDTGIENAKWVLENHHAQECKEANSSTEIYQLVEKLLGRT